jgi:carbamoyl-phosphate synthase small subunit
LSLQGTFPPAILALADGTVFIGNSIGATGSTVGEVVFNTAMTGYQEILTDPSYCQQIVTLTYPHIGNTASTAGHRSRQGPCRWPHHQGPAAAGQQLPRDATLSQYLVRRTHGRHRQHRHPQADPPAAHQGRPERRHRGPGRWRVGDPSPHRQAIAAAQGAPSMAGQDLAKVVSVAQPYEWGQTEWKTGCPMANRASARRPHRRFHVVAYDFGVKRNILRMLAERGCKVTVVPAQTPAAEVLAKCKPDGIFLSNGPGDPEPCDYAIAAVAN